MAINNKGQKIVWLLKAVLASYIITGIMLFVMSLLLNRFEMGKNWLELGITATYIMSNFMGGYIMGKLVEEKRFLWGIGVGVIYITLLYGISFGLYGEAGFKEPQEIKTILLCVAGGMFGGMLS